MLRSFLLATLSLCLTAAPAHAQGKTKSSDQRAILEQILTQNYQPSEVGKHVMGIGAETDVRKPGIIVVIQREGLYGSLLRSEIASSAIHGLEAKLYRGHQDYSVPAGERFYVTTVHVGLSTVDIGLLSARAVSVPHGSGRVWTAATFYLPEETLADADKDTVFRAIDSWLVPEGRVAASAAPAPALPGVAPAAAAVVATQPAPPAASPSTETIALSPGMTREQIIAALGKPLHEVSFQTQTWMHYAAMVVTLRDGHLVSVEAAGAPSTASITLRSEPGGAEIFIDGQLAGATPSTLQVPAGNRQIRIRLPGYSDWVRDVRVLAGSDIQFNARLEK